MAMALSAKLMWTAMVGVRDEGSGTFLLLNGLWCLHFGVPRGPYQCVCDGWQFTRRELP